MARSTRSRGGTKGGTNQKGGKKMAKSGVEAAAAVKVAAKAPVKVEVVEAAAGPARPETLLVGGRNNAPAKRQKQIMTSRG